MACNAFNATRGWLLGHFLDPAEGLRSTNDVEVKWGIHQRGDKGPPWAVDEQRTTVVLLIEGKFRIDFTDGSTVLTTQGDYVIRGSGADHSWEALTDAVVITIRWPSSLPKNDVPKLATQPGMQCKSRTRSHRH